MTKANQPAMTFAILMAIGLLPIQARAQGDVNSYKVGEKIEYKEGYYPRETWFEGTVIKLDPEYKQLVIRWDPRPEPYYAAYTHDGVSTWQQGYSIDKVRHITAHATDKAKNKKDEANATINPADNAKKSKADELTRGDKGAQTTAAPPANPPRATTTPPPAGAPREVGEKVEAWNTIWYKGVVTEIGSGDYKGYYRIHSDTFVSNQWVSAANIRSLSSPAVPSSAGPRLGKYHMLSYGSPANPPIRLGHFELMGGGRYRYFDNGNHLLGEGSYSFDGKAQEVHWLNGPFKTDAWGGKFEIDREGKTHKIRLRPTTIGSNSTDS